MHFILELNMDNAAFTNNLNEMTEILQKVILDFPEPKLSGKNVQDSNGNTVGKWEVAE